MQLGLPNERFEGPEKKLYAYLVPSKNSEILLQYENFLSNSYLQSNRS